MLWVDALQEIETLCSQAGRSGLVVRDVQYDSRRIGNGDLFVAMRGDISDGSRFTESALAAGAAAVITDAPEQFADLSMRYPERGVALVSHGRRGLSQASAAIFDHPERRLALTAVTGTNGKTTTTWVLEQLLRADGRRSVLVGTIETRVVDQVLPSPHTTPESRDLLATFRAGVEAGCTEAVIEASSHALEQERIYGMPVDVAVWTNLTQDHLDYHCTMEHYFAAKARLFKGVGTPPPRVAVVNGDDQWAREQLLPAGPGSQVMRYGLDAARAEYRAEDVHLSAGLTRFRFVTPAESVDVVSPLTGRVNVYNVLAAMCAALARGMDLRRIVDAVGRIEQVPGRFQVVPANGSDLTVVVDYAHTEDALRNLLALARELVAAREGRVITVFGCGGNRDRSKRRKMGRAAAEASDLVIVTSDNPRSEDPAAIIDDVMVGVHETGVDCIVEEDRAGAIAIALRAATPGDIVLIAGKGHERVQILKDQTIPFDDVAVAADLLRELR